MKGYKVFNENWKCMDFQYEVGKTYEHEGELKICEKGFHFCKALKDCFSYYDFNPKNKVAEIDAIGDIGEIETDNRKSVTNKITIIREISWEEVLQLVNTGDGNTGINNAGDWNKGNGNAGNENMGDWNAGNWNAGNRNTGNWNAGNRNAGDGNTGNWNTGNWNTGNWNAGNRNTGNWNAGDWNAGDWNAGNCNVGNYNCGSWNASDRNSGFFNTLTPKICLFNEPTDLSIEDIRKIEGIRILNYSYENNWWIRKALMTDEEKEQYPSYKTTGGYLKTIPYKEACQLMWNKLTSVQKKEVMGIPNFNAEIFKKITGIEIDDKTEVA